MKQTEVVLCSVDISIHHIFQYVCSRDGDELTKATSVGRHCRKKKKVSQKRFDVPLKYQKAAFTQTETSALHTVS